MIKTKLTKNITQQLTLATHLYTIALCSWVFINYFYRDAWWWLFLINTFAIYLFVPLPFLLIFAMFMSKSSINFKVRVWFSVGIVFVLAFYFYGELFLPHFKAKLNTQQKITVMTYNALGYNQQIAEVAEVIKTVNADVVAIQELNLLLAEYLQQVLISEYPYQILEAEDGVCGIGLISRYPLTPTHQTLAHRYWCGTPQILEMKYAKQRVTLINFHAMPPASLSNPEEMAWRTDERELQALAFVNFVNAHPYPIIALGDLNTADQSVAYKTITNVLTDAWRQGGWGAGHTFPGANSPGSSRPRIAGFLVPKWLVRIDYIFYSKHWATEQAWVGPWDGYSDHRPVIATLIYK